MVDILMYIQGHSQNGVALSELSAIVPERDLRQIRHLLERLGKQEKIVSKGAGRGAHWFDAGK